MGEREIANRDRDFKSGQRLQIVVEQDSINNQIYISSKWHYQKTQKVCENNRKEKKIRG